MDWIAAEAYEASRDACTATPATTQATRVNAFNAALASEVDGLGVIERAHRTTCSAKNTSLWLTSPDMHIHPDTFSAALCWRVGICHVAAAQNTCRGCNRLFSDREYSEHIVGCANLRVVNCATTHDTVNRALQQLATAAGITSVDEPRYAEYVPPNSQATDEDDHKHEEGPDSTFHLARPLTIDLKGIVPSCKTHALRAPSAVAHSKITRSRELYENVVHAYGQRFAVPCFHVSGYMDATLCGIVAELCAERPDHLSVRDELRRLCVRIQWGVGNILLYHTGRGHVRRCGGTRGRGEREERREGERERERERERKERERGGYIFYFVLFCFFCFVIV
jgi:hypothetical protein